MRRNQDTIYKTNEEIKKIKSAIDIKKPRPAVKIKNNIEISLRKAQINPNFDSRTVLTDSTWHYVELILKRNKDKKALNYWHQAQNFFKATETLDLLSKPLTTYYCFLNATKALLTVKKIRFDTKHGVSGKSTSGSINLNNEMVYLHPRGVLSGLCNYLEEPVVTTLVPSTNKRLPESYNLKDILYNLEYIHRAYNLTYTNQTELFIPIEEPRFVHDKSQKKGWIELRLEPEYSSENEFSKITGFGKDIYYDQVDYYTIRLNKKFKWDAPRNNPTTESLQELSKYYKNHRKRFRYIYSANKLWYIKRKNLAKVINRGTLPLTFGAMHRLSEMSRYDPNTLEKHLEKSYGWLLSEFITKSIHQFVDMVSSEITGDDFRVTGFRT
ncbi:hypothetical protein CQJ38_13895 [Bacillus velezensis]|nr:hypothetical protein CQJ38_13895 [Bacillus velezensis]